MKTGYWERLEALFFDALECNSEQRAAFLDHACAGDPGLRDEVEAMLAAHARSCGFLIENRLLEGVQDDDEPSRPDARLGTHVGPYRLAERIGQGGMGTVYRAERDDGQYRQQVALKLIRPGLHPAEALARFRRERQILAQLAHPHIARLLDGGMTDEGQPYFVMEYVEGVPIDQYADARRLTVEARLRLFEAVCEAVQAAHQNLIVHRDLKPSNILVAEADGGQPQVKLLDFGIAKLLSADDEPVDAERTRTGLRVMTPAYAAPEQIRGEAVTTATDVYALGTVLYELLTGHHPFSVRARSLSEMERAICTAEPPRPSTLVMRSPRGERAEGATPEQVAAARSTVPERLRRRLAGDLDAILLKALEKEPARRYRSAEGLLTDLSRHLSGTPVEARAPSVAYRTRKFVRRHRWGVAVALGASLLLVSYALTVTLQAQRIALERDRARLEAEKNVQVTDFLIGLFEAPDPERALGDTLTAYDLLERGREHAERGLAEQPLIQAAMLNVLGRTYLGMGRRDLAEPLLKASLSLRRRHLGPSHEEVARSMRDLGQVYAVTNRYERAERLYAGALTIQRELLGSVHADVAYTLFLQGELQHETGDYETAEQSYRAAVEVGRRLQDTGTGHPDLAVALQHLALLLQVRGRYADARPLFEEALAVQQSRRSGAHPDLALLLNDYAMLLQRLGERDAAERLFREALGMQRKVLGPRHPHLIFGLSNLGSLVMDRDLEEADSLISQALRLARGTTGPAHPLTAIATYYKAKVLRTKGELKAARKTFEDALRIARRAFPAKHPRIGWVQVGLGGVLLDQGQATQAAPLLREGARLLVQSFGEAHPLSLDARQRLAEALIALGHYSEAESLLVDSYATLTSQQGDDDEQVRRILGHLVALYEAWGRPENGTAYRRLLRAS